MHSVTVIVYHLLAHDHALRSACVCLSVREALTYTASQNHALCEMRRTQLLACEIVHKSVLRSKKGRKQKKGR